MLTFVLVHGAWHDGGCWDAVVAALERRGHRAFAPTLPGHGSGADRDVGHEDCWRSVADYLERQALENVVLAGHSFGGTVIQKAAEAVPARIRRLVFVNAFVLRDGESVLELNPPQGRQVMERLAAASRDGSFLLPFKVWRETFMNDADLALARAAYARLSPQPWRPLAEPVPLPAFEALDLPRSYIHATEDTALPPGPQWGWHPRMSSRLGLYRLVQMPGGHETLFTAPERLAEKLVEAGRD